MNQPLTDSERILSRLAYRSFLSLWSYPRPFRDQGNPPKELCDLLVVFDNHVLLFSDKYIGYPDTGQPQVDWERWYRKAVLESAQQIFGAERWIKKYPTRIFLDPQCQTEFPLDIPSVEKLYFHRIVVANGASKRVKRDLGGSGSLHINTGISDNSEPFTVGSVLPEQGFVHIFDDVSFPILLQTLDTITDFINYLSRRETLFTNEQHIVISYSEEDLLAHYLKNMGDNGHDFLFYREQNSIFLEVGTWIKFIQSPEYRSQQKADSISYEWDKLIENFNYNTITETKHNHSKGIKNQEKGTRYLARESRFKRRILAEKFFEFIDETPLSQPSCRIAPSKSAHDNCYIFLVLPTNVPISYNEYRKRRLRILEMLLYRTKLQFPNTLNFIGIATETRRNNREFPTEDLIVLDTHVWTEKDDLYALECKNILSNIGFLGDGKPKYIHFDEYPRTELTKREKRYSNRESRKFPRNNPCVYGSGKKYKYCCGKSG